MPRYTLTTRRLRLEPVTWADTAALHRFWTDRDVRRFLWDNQVIDRETVEGIINDSECSFREAGFGQWVIRLGDKTRLSGFCGLRPFGEHADIEIMYGIVPAHWGRGLAVEAASAVLAHGFEYGDLEAIVAEMDVPNRASIRVAEKLGMRFVRQYERNGLATLRYELTRDAWRAGLRDAD